MADAGEEAGADRCRRGVESREPSAWPGRSEVLRPECVAFERSGTARSSGGGLMRRSEKGGGGGVRVCGVPWRGGSKDEELGAVETWGSGGRAG